VTKLGVTLPQFTDDADRLIDGALAAEELGLDSMWLFDHLWPLTGGRERPIFDSWTTLAYIAARTERIQIGVLVTRSTLREPVLLARMAATVEAVAPGRFVLALGSGDELSRAENESFGIPYFGGEDRVPQLIAALEVIRACFAEPPTTVHTPYHRVEGLPSGLSVAPPPLWVGGRSHEVLETAGRWCEGWNAWSASPKSFAREAEVVRRAAGGRPIELSWGGQVILAGTDAEAEGLLGSRPRRDFILGAPETVAERLDGLRAAGAEHLIAAFPYAGREAYALLAGPVRAALG
jgi:alkanesulfonate monooxygenase SsuD/methylene tetrahydromethanopterin reductase-like flavin-dependent oxidoreductase (luciferase family)